MTDFAIVVVRLWHDVARWEPGLVRVRTEWFVTQAAKASMSATYVTEGKQPAFEIWYAPTEWGGRGLTCCASLSLYTLETAARVNGSTPAHQRDLFAGGLGNARPTLVLSTKACTARPTIPPFLDDEGVALMRVQMDWAVDADMVDVTHGHTQTCGEHPWIGVHGNGVGQACTQFGASDAQDAFKLVALWRERELRAEIQRLRGARWGDRIVGDPRKVTLAGRSARTGRNARVR